MSYPVTFEADYVERRSRLSTFFRLLLLIPIGIWLYFYAAVGAIATIVAWLAIVITGRMPAGVYGFISDYNRFLARLTAYASLLCDPYPPFTGAPKTDYPVRMDFAGPPERYSRLRALFRFILAIPILVLRYAMNILLEIGALASWFIVVVTGKMPRGLFDMMVLANSYTARSDSYLFLLTESYPPFQDEQTRTAGVA